MSENIISLQEALIKKQGTAPLEIPSSGHLVTAAVMLERLRENASTALLGMQKCPERSNDIRVHLKAIAELIYEVDLAFGNYTEIMSCQGSA